MIRRPAPPTPSTVSAGAHDPRAPRTIDQGAHPMTVSRATGVTTAVREDAR